MHYFILAGSHRPQAQSSKVGGYIETTLWTLFPDDTSFLYDLRENPLPLRNDRFRDKQSSEYQEFTKIRAPIATELEKADAVVIISPERAGMATPAVKNFMLYTDAHLCANKPALLVSVSAGRGGRYPIAELRMSSTKNNQLCYIPQHVIVDHVGDVLNDYELTGTEKADSFIKARLQYSLKMLEAYAQWLQWVRTSGVSDITTYPYGM